MLDDTGFCERGRNKQPRQMLRAGVGAVVAVFLGVSSSFALAATAYASPDDSENPADVAGSEKLVEITDGDDLVVTASVTTDFTRKYLWKIKHRADHTQATVDVVPGSEEFLYTVVTTPHGYRDTGWQVAGEIAVQNINEDAPVDAVITAELDVGGGAICEVQGDKSSQIHIPAGKSVMLPYRCTFETAPKYEGSLHVEVAYESPAQVIAAKASSLYAAASYSERTVDANEPLVFRNPREENRTITVRDNRAKTESESVGLGVATWNGEGTSTELISHLELVGIIGKCKQFTNVAWIVETDQSAKSKVEECVRLEFGSPPYEPPAEEPDPAAEPPVPIVLPPGSETEPAAAPSTPTTPTKSKALTKPTTPASAVPTVVTLTTGEKVPASLTRTGVDVGREVIVAAALVGVGFIAVLSGAIVRRR